MKKIILTKNIIIFSSDKYYEVNIVLYKNYNESIIIDCGTNKKEFIEVLSYVKKNNLTLKYIIYTHFHFDHIFGSWTINDSKCDIIAHKNFKFNLLLNALNLEDMDGSTYSILWPNIYFEDQMKIKLGKSIIYLFEMPGHTSDSIVIYIKDQNVLVAGDTLNYIPYIKWGDFNESIYSLNKLLKFDVDYIILGHYGYLNKEESIELIVQSLFYLEKLNDETDMVINEIMQLKRKYTIDVDKLYNINNFMKSDYRHEKFIQELHKKNILHLLQKKIGNILN
jgi:hydroxyacylglutathione hydrolase